MSRRTENEKTFKSVSYWRILRFVRPYWLMLSIGILAGLLVGGSLFGGLMLLPDMAMIVDQDTGQSVKNRKTAEEVIEALEEAPDDMSDEEKTRLVAEIVSRQPFPGPGLGVRIIGEVTAEKCRIVQDADAIYREEIAKAVSEGRMKEPNQYFAALTNMQTVGVMGDFRTYDYAIALRAVTTSDFMTAEAAEIPWDVLQRAMTRIVNEVDYVNRVFYDLTSKPPGTVEME